MYIKGSFGVPLLLSVTRKEILFASAMSSAMLPVVSMTKHIADDWERPISLEEHERDKKTTSPHVLSESCECKISLQRIIPHKILDCCLFSPNF